MAVLCCIYLYGLFQEQNPSEEKTQPMIVVPAPVPVENTITEQVGSAGTDEGLQQLKEMLVTVEERLDDFKEQLNEKRVKLSGSESAVNGELSRVAELERQIKEKDGIIAERDALIDKAKVYSQALKQEIAVLNERIRSTERDMSALKQQVVARDARIAELSDRSGSRERVPGLRGARPHGNAGNEVIRLGE